MNTSQLLNLLCCGIAEHTYVQRGKKRCNSNDEIDVNTMAVPITEVDSKSEHMIVSGDLPVVVGTNVTKKKLERKKKKQDRDVRKLSKIEAEEQRKAFRTLVTAKTRETLGLADFYSCSIVGCDQSFGTKTGRLAHEEHCTGAPKQRQTLLQNFQGQLRQVMLLGNSSSDSDAHIRDHTSKPLDWIITVSRYFIIMLNDVITLPALLHYRIACTLVDHWTRT